MNYPLMAGSRWLCFAYALLLIIPGACAFTVSPVTITPSDILNPNDPVEVSCTVYAAYGVAFPSYDDLQFVTELDDPVWSYSIVVNGIENVRPVDRGKYLTISGFELNYENKDEVNVDVILKGQVPATAALGADKMILKIQELDARSYVLPNSVVQIDHLIGLPTPTPTPAYGSIRVTSEPAGATVYLDNAIKGISPVTLDGIPNGAHSILVRLDGYNDYTRDVTVTGDSSQTSAVLTRTTATGATVTSAATSPATAATVSTTTASTQPQALQTGTLSVTTSPPGAIVYIDDQMKGITPATIPGLSPGSHSIHLILDGYEDFWTTTEITAGTTSEFVTGLSKRKQLPGFAMAGALLAVGLTVALLRQRPRKD